MIVVEAAECPPENMKHDRRIPNLDECCKLGETQGELGREEVIAVVLYTEPMVSMSYLHVGALRLILCLICNTSNDDLI
jgi:hypothetical protein